MSPGIRNVYALAELGFAARWLINNARGRFAGSFEVTRYAMERIDARVALLSRNRWQRRAIGCRVVQRFKPLLPYEREPREPR